MQSRKNHSKNEVKVGSPFAKLQRRRFQFSLRSLLLLMTVGAIFSASIVLALFTPEVRKEVAAWTGAPVPAAATIDHRAQLIFSLFCYCSPLMLALAVRLINLIVRWIDQVSTPKRLAESQDPFASD